MADRDGRDEEDRMYGVGVDLGTSFAAAAVAQAGALDMVRLGGQAVVTPSAAYLDENGVLLTGEVADRLGLRDSSRVAREFKRRLGDPTPVLLAGAPHSPTALMAALLRSITDTVSKARGGPPDHVVLTHPAVWGPYRREQFAAVAPLAGLPRPRDPHAGEAAPHTGGTTVDTVTEPVAAATYYCSTKPLPPDGLLAVYDLGGGTFDSAIVRNGADGLEIVGTPEGIEWLGGADFDQAILENVNRQLGGAVTRLDPADPGTAALLAAILRECVLAKEALSTRLQAEVTVPLPDGVRHVTVTRDMFEKTITPSLDATVEAFRRALTSADITPQDLTAVLLVGGSSQIPRVTEVLRDTLRRPILINAHPKHAVALGAAMLSADALRSRTTSAAARSARRPAVSAALPPNAAGAGAATTGPAATGATAAGVAGAASAPVGPTAPGPVVAASAAPPSGAPGDAADGSGRAPAATAPVRRRAGSRYVLLPALLVLAALLVVAFLVAPKLWPADPPVCGTADAALNRPVTASSEVGAGFTATNAVDGDSTSRWSSAAGDPQWLRVDLGNQVDVCGVSIEWENAHATAFQVELSADGTSWTSVWSTTTGRGGAQDLTVSGTGRYLRVHGTSRAGDYGYSIWDVHVYTTGPATNVALSGTSDPASPSPSPTAPAPTTRAATAASPTATAAKSQSRASRSATPSASTPAKPSGPGTSALRSVATGLCLDSDTEPVMALNGTPMGGHAFGTACTGASGQKWREGKPLSEDSVPSAEWYRLVDQQTAFCLDSNDGGAVYTLPCLNPNDHQLWQRVSQPRPAVGPAPAGTVVAYRNLATGKCLSMSSSERTPRTLRCPSGDAWPAEMLFRR
ncbi:Hsp70 family protein [Micromonospora sp. KLBMP9576]|uniref:Hsp70 family protein n=1 Tax=Micromonospora sp. KLBMP9576 TaxID=3424769 RepID=UPI003D8DBF9A